MSRLLSTVRRHLGRGTFRASVLTLLSGTVLALSLAYLARPILARLYTPEDFGLTRFFIALVGALLPVVSFKYEDAVMLPEGHDEARRVLTLAALITAGMSALSGLLYLFREPFARLFHEPGIAGWLWLVPPALLIMRGAKLMELWYTRRKRFAVISTAQVTRTGVMVAARLGAGIPSVAAGAAGLIGGFVLGHLSEALRYLIPLVRRRERVNLPAASFRGLTSLARRYARFPQYSMPSALLSSLVTQLPMLLLIGFFDRRTLGLYGMAFNTLLIPLSLVGAAVSQVFFVHGAEAHRAAGLPGLTSNIHGRLVMLGLYPTLALMVGAPDVFAFVFSDPWREAGEFLRYLAPWLLLSAVASPLTRLFDILERQRLDLITSLLMFLALSTALILGGGSGDIRTCLMYLGTAGFGARLIQVGILLRLGRVAFADALRPYVRYLAGAVPGMLLVGLSLPFGRPWLTTLTFTVGAALYLVLVIRRERVFPLAPPDQPVC